MNFGITEWRTKREREREREKISFRWEIERYIILEFVVEYFFFEFCAVSFWVGGKFFFSSLRNV